MRSYLDIIIDLKDGKRPDYEEVRLACIMAQNLLFFADKSIEMLTGYCTDKEKTDLQSKLAIKSYEDRFYAKKKSPDEWLGSYHPDNPEQKKSMEVSNKIFNNYIKNKGNI